MAPACVHPEVADDAENCCASVLTSAHTHRPKATPTGYVIPAHCRVRTDVIDVAGVITIRYNSRLHHIGLGKRRTGTKVTVLIDDLDIRVLAGELQRAVGLFCIGLAARDYPVHRYGAPGQT